MSGQYKVAWLCEALLVSRSGYYDWKERHHRPGPRQLENTHLRAHRRGLALSGRRPGHLHPTGSRLGHESHPRDAPLTIAALRMALTQRPPRRALIVHSDRGRQFASAAFRQLLAQHGLLASMSRKGNCYDNAFIESFWSSLKYEVVYHRRFATHAEARTAIFDYIETFYNRTRLHSSLAYRSPINFESNLNK